MVEAGVSDDVTQRYFKRSDAADGADNRDAAANDEGDPFEADSLRLPSPDDADSEEESFFERTLKELEDRLKQPPSDGPNSQGTRPPK